ncbi:putative sulfate/molybdate transporter [Methanosphaerula palustris]|uniref:Sulphate transporter n=1 Tax=Methanosphaerula palustris (strain ATCC BAA-1556 / DSM 19958 / E1-9c) TaxID=521011 RepID=B8GHN7_METPE|nr:putative sulfate/molybdate transporter [Methanosphaerula palustris]ACL16642.1 sulphate transporter [Methanosphaerula palustris E1-9c]
MTRSITFHHALSEISGSLGDFGTILPLTFGMILATGAPAGPVLLLLGLWHLFAGVVYKTPIPVEPMKVIAVLVIAGQADRGTMAAAGLILGFLFLSLGISGWISVIVERIPEPVTRGIQLGLALLLVRSGFQYAIPDPYLAIIGVGIILFFIMAHRFSRLPDLSAIAVLVIGVALGISLHGLPAWGFPFPQGLTIPGIGDWPAAAGSMVVPQMIQTLTNSIAAVVLITGDLFKTRVSPARVSTSLGIMNLISAPLGGIPVCHGAGGVAALYRFGASTSIANYIAGGVLIVIAIFSADHGVVTLFPVGLLGSLLFFVAIDLGRSGLKTNALPTTLVTGIVSAATSVTIGFLAGVIVWLIQRFIIKRRENDGERPV